MNFLEDKKGLFGLQQWVTSLIAIILVSFLMLSFVLNFISIKNPSSNIFDSKYGLNNSLNSMNSRLFLFEGMTNNIKSTLSNSNAAISDYVFLIFKEAFYIPITILQFVGGSLADMSNLFNNMLSKQTGLSPMIITLISVLISGLIFITVVLVIRYIRTGQE